MLEERSGTRQDLTDVEFSETEPSSALKQLLIAHEMINIYKLNKERNINLKLFPKLNETPQTDRSKIHSIHSKLLKHLPY